MTKGCDHEPVVSHVDITPDGFIAGTVTIKCRLCGKTFKRGHKIKRPK